MPRLVDKKRAAKILGVSPHSMNRLMTQIAFIRVGRGRVLFDVADLHRYIEQKKVQPQSRPTPPPVRVKTILGEGGPIHG